MHNLSSMTVTVSKGEALERLKKNRELHAVIVKEAREAYANRALDALTKRIEKLKTGKIVSLSFSLRPPQDHTDVYNTAIEMLELHCEEHVEMSAGQVRNLMMDEWDWMDQFLVANAGYSGTAREYAREKGTRLPEELEDE
jgi:hypothetical protein